MTLHLSDKQISLLIDGDLSHVAQEAARLHLRHCLGCAQRHDEFVGVVTAFRLQPAVRWRPELAPTSVDHLPEQTASSPPRCLGAQRNRSLALPLATTLVAIAAFLAALLIPVVRSGVGIAHSSFETISDVLPSPIALSPSGSLIGLLVLAIVCPWLSLRLARKR